MLTREQILARQSAARTLVGIAIHTEREDRKAIAATIDKEDASREEVMAGAVGLLRVAAKWIAHHQGETPEDVLARMAVGAANREDELREDPDASA